MNAADRASFPNASRIVRVGDTHLNSEDDDLLQKWSEVLEQRAKDWQPCALEALLDLPPRVRHGNAHAYLLFGPRAIFVDDHKITGKIRGLVFENLARVSRKGNFVLNL